MKHIPHTLQLETDRFLLRQLTRDDFPALIRYLETEPGLWRYSLVQMAGSDDMIRYAESALADLAQGTAFPFVVIEKATNAIVGSTRFYDMHFNYGTTLLGYTWYATAQQGTGINAHCKYLLLRYAFEKLALERVEFRADVRNVRSLAAMRKIGCVEEGVLRSHLPVADGTRRDTIIFSILREEWFEQVKQRLEQRMDTSV